MKKKAADYIEQYGLLGTPVWFLFTFLKAVWMKFVKLMLGKCLGKWIEKHRWRKETKKLRKDKKELLQQFKSCWENTVCSGYRDRLGNCSMPAEGIGSASQDIFLEMVVDDYAFAKYKVKRNKKKNFFWKGAFVAILLGGFLGFSALFYLDFGGGGNFLLALGRDGLLLFLFVLLSGSIAKWLDIRKYQETWARHTKRCYLLEKEMLLFLYDIPPYDGIDKKSVFFMNVMEIWDMNQQKFVTNMEQREKELMDIFERFEEEKNV